MNVEHISAFSIDGAGGDPAGVMIADKHPSAEDMQSIAAKIGYPETAFLEPKGDGWRVRYFAPKMEVPFCGHATIALGAALGAHQGPGVYPLTLNDAKISVEAFESADGWSAALTSPPTYELTPASELVQGVRDIFSITDDDLSDGAPISRISAGADMIMIPLKSRERLAQLDYDVPAGADLLNAHNIIGAYFVFKESDDRYHVRMAFPTGGIFEDPATGAAAAALSGWLRDSGRKTGEITIIQAEDTGSASRLIATSTPEIGAPVRVSGATRRLD